MIKLVVTDVDGTLLDSDSELTELNRRALLDCKKKGIGVILATGKSPHAVIPLVNMLGLALPQITLNGAVVIDRNQNVIHSTVIDSSSYYELLQVIKSRGYKPLIALNNGRILYDSYDPVYSIFDKINEPIFKADALEKDEFAEKCVSVSVAIRETDPLDSFLRKNFSSTLQLVRSGEYFFDILNLKASKGEALKYIISKTHIKSKEVAVFGDSPNDLSMFEYAGLRIAVRNSYPEILKNADYITDENYNSGLGKAIYKYILK